MAVKKGDSLDIVLITIDALRYVRSETGSSRPEVVKCP